MISINIIMADFYQNNYTDSYAIIELNSKIIMVDWYIYDGMASFLSNLEFAI